MDDETNLKAVLQQHLANQRPIWLFLDYDGTLVPIANTPDEARPTPDLLDLLSRLVSKPRLHVAILSGRSLATLQALLPLQGLILAGLYGLEVQTPIGTVKRYPEQIDVLTTIAALEADWSRLVAGKPGFLIENKGASVALHARFASEQDAAEVLAAAEKKARKREPQADFRVLGGNRFLEVAPAAAHKGKSVTWLIKELPLPNALPVYFGDDDKDEEAFDQIRQSDGLTVAVGPREMKGALFKIDAPETTRRILRSVFASANTEVS